MVVIMSPNNRNWSYSSVRIVSTADDVVVVDVVVVVVVVVVNFSCQRRHLI